MQQKYISWDFTVDEAGDIVFIEMNSPGGSEVIQCLGINSYINSSLVKKVLDNCLYFRKATLNWDYREYSDHILLLEYCGRGKKAVVPKTIKGKRVTLIAGSAFNRSAVTEVVKPESVSFAIQFSSRKDKIKVTEFA